MSNNPISKDDESVRRIFASLLEQLANARIKARDGIDNVKMFLNTNPEYGELVEFRDEWKDMVAGLEDAVRDQAMDFLSEVGRIPDIDGIGVREYDQVKYDKQEAEKWIKENLPALMTPDWKAFEKLMKSGNITIPDFVEIEKEPKITISGNLDAYIEDEVGADD